MAKNKVKVMGPKINATKEIDITDFKVNNRFYGTHRNEVVLDKKYDVVRSALDDRKEYVHKENEFLKIVSSSKYFKIDKTKFPYRAYPIINVQIPDIFNHNNGNPIRCNACVRDLEIYQTDYYSKYCYLRFKLTILDYTNPELENNIDTIQVVKEPFFWEDGRLCKSILE